MELIPEFKIGLWNGWILSAIFLVHNFIMMFIPPKENTKEMMDQMKKASGKDRLFMYLSQTVYYVIMICAIFMPLKLLTPWFFVGLTIFVLGFILLIVVEVHFFFRKPGQLMTKGFYRISRNPQYVMCYITWTGIGVAVADSHSEVIAVADYVTKKAGGNGAVREVCNLILKGLNGTNI